MTTPTQALAATCFHQNGAFEVALRALGFTVERRFGQVQGRPFPRLNHLVLLVTIDGRRWWPDLGLGDALREPVEVVAGEIRQGPYRYEITDVGAAGSWTFRHDPAAGSFPAVEVRADQPTDAEVAESHRVLSTPPDGRFTEVLVVQRRDDTGVSVLRGIRYQRSGDGPFTRDLTSHDDWRAVLRSLGVSFAGVTDDELRSLHARMRTAHEKWLATAEPLKPAGLTPRTFAALGKECDTAASRVTADDTPPNGRAYRSETARKGCDQPAQPHHLADPASRRLGRHGLS